MNFLRLHWFDLGLALAVVVGAGVLLTRPTGLALILWISLLTLFLHQFEEYRFPGYFPGMMNSVMFGSRQPDRYPLNTNTSLLVNVVEGWLLYFLAAVFNTQAVWLGIAAMLVSVGNVVAHTLLFNLRGHTLYNPGLATALVLFLPLAIYFYGWLIATGTASALDWILGLVLGLVLNYVGVLKLIEWLADPQTPYVFPARFLRPARRQSVVESRESIVESAEG